MNVLRRAPLSRLLLAVLVLVLAGTGAAYGVSAVSGPQPPPAPLANAIHDALAAPQVQGITADVTLTNQLVIGDVGGGPPLLSGGSGRVWASDNGDVRFELQSDSGDTEIYYANGTLSYFDTASGTLYRFALSQLGFGATGARGMSGDGTGADGQSHAIPSVAEIEHSIESLMQHAGVSGATPSDVAGQPAYSVRISPSHDGGLVGGVALWWDALHGVPLRLDVYASNQTAPVLELTATQVSYGPVSASVFEPPKAAKTVDVTAPTVPAAGSAGAQGDHVHHAPVTGVAAVRAALQFPLAAPATLAGMPLASTRLLDWGGHQAALVRYGKGLGGIAVIEQQADAPTTPAAPTTNGQGDGQGPNLPTIDVNGASATELPTALGTLVRFSRGGVSYTVVGSVSSDVAASAARGL